MGLFAGVAAAKTNAGAMYAKKGKYWCLIQYVKHDTHVQKKWEFIAVETLVIHVIDNAEGKGPKAGEPCSFLFPETQEGALGRLRALIKTVVKCEDSEITEDAVRELVDPALQPLRDMVVEVFATDRVTKAGKNIIGEKFMRRVYATEIKENLDKLSETTKTLLAEGGRLERMLANEVGQTA